MDLIDEIRALGARIPKQIQLLQTEQATKNALVMPFIGALGYNVFDPTEVMPEFTADIGTKQGEKVDYAIIKDGKPIMLFECKAAHVDLEEHVSQLFRYFAVTEARFGILTNGVLYRFHSDLDEPNKMDLRPFLEFNILEVDDALVEELKRFTKSSFDLDSTLEAASELKYTKEIKRVISEQLREPSDDFVRFFASQIYSGSQAGLRRRMTQSVRQKFAEHTKEALNQLINDRINERLKSAMTTEDEKTAKARTRPLDRSISEDTISDQGVTRTVTTEEELQGYYIVKAILHEVVDLKRVAFRDMTAHSVILLDDTNRRPICRLWFNRPQKYLGLINEQREEERVPIEDIDDIYKYADRLKATVSYYEQSRGEGQVVVA